MSMESNNSNVKSSKEDDMDIDKNAMVVLPECFPSSPSAPQDMEALQNLNPMQFLSMSYADYQALGIDEKLDEYVKLNKNDLDFKKLEIEFMTAVVDVKNMLPIQREREEAIQKENSKIVQNPYFKCLNKTPPSSSPSMRKNENVSHVMEAAIGCVTKLELLLKKSEDIIAADEAENNTSSMEEPLKKLHRYASCLDAQRILDECMTILKKCYNIAQKEISKKKNHVNA